MFRDYVDIGGEDSVILIVGVLMVGLFDGVGVGDGFWCCDVGSGVVGMGWGLCRYLCYVGGSKGSNEGGCLLGDVLVLCIWGMLWMVIYGFKDIVYEDCFSGFVSMFN